MNTQKDDMRSAVTIRWRQYLQTDLDRLNHARDMLQRAKSDQSRDVIIVAILAIGREMQIDLDHLDGLAAAW
jgi:hypothetical protein